MIERTAPHPAAVVYTVDQFCTLMQHSRDKFEDLVRRGELAAFKVGRRTYVAKAEAERWLHETQRLACIPIHAPVHVSRRGRNRNTAAQGGKQKEQVVEKT